MSIIRLITLIYTVLLFNKGKPKKEKHEPVRLNKKIKSEHEPETSPRRFKITPELLLVITVIVLLIIIPLLVYSTGCLESTTYYNRGGFK